MMSNKDLKEVLTDVITSILDDYDGPSETLVRDVLSDVCHKYGYQIQQLNSLKGE